MSGVQSLYLIIINLLLTPNLTILLSLFCFVSSGHSLGTAAVLVPHLEFRHLLQKREPAWKLSKCLRCSIVPRTAHSSSCN